MTTAAGQNMLNIQLYSTPLIFRSDIFRAPGTSIKVTLISIPLCMVRLPKGVNEPGRIIIHICKFKGQVGVGVF
jgi:hypothetical protein